MTRYSSRPSQRQRRLLNQEALKRAHRRGERIRLLPDDEPAGFAPQRSEALEHTDPSTSGFPCF